MNSRLKAVRPNLNVTTQEDDDDNNSLSHHGETDRKVKQQALRERPSAREGQSQSSTDKNLTQSTVVEEGGLEQEDVEDEEEEAQEPVTRRAPKGPTKEEREKHDATHLQFREWCDHCVRGRGRNSPHKKKQEEDEQKETKVVRISMDYFFMSQEEEKASENPLMVMLDESTGNRYMRAVGRKGLGDNNEMDWLIKDMHEELKAWG